MKRKFLRIIMAAILLPALSACDVEPEHIDVSVSSGFGS